MSPAILVSLTKPRVVLLAVFCAIIGMFLATDGMVPWTVLVCGTAGITLLAASGFVLNCLIERHIDAQMGAPRIAPSPPGRIRVGQRWCSPPSSAAAARCCSTCSSIR